MTWQIIAWASGAYVIVLALITAVFLMINLKESVPGGIIALYIALLLCFTIIIFTLIVTIPDASELEQSAFSVIALLILSFWTVAAISMFIN